MRAFALALVAARLNQPASRLGQPAGAAGGGGAQRFAESASDTGGGAPIRTGVPAEVLPSASPVEWQKCAEKCTGLDTVPHDCMHDSGVMHVAPHCFSFTCDLFACLGQESDCAAVKEEMWSRVSQATPEAEDGAMSLGGQNTAGLDRFLEECGKGTFTCLAQCPRLNALVRDEPSTWQARCSGGKEARAQCEQWVLQAHDCVQAHAECGSSTFERIPDLEHFNVSALAFGVPNDEIRTLKSIATQMDEVVVAAKTAFETTFMVPCKPGCLVGEHCLYGHCVARPISRRFRAPVTEEPPQWWDDFRKERPNHPQRDHWNQGKSLYWW